MDAVNRGDMETAQKMVDEEAKRHGYNIKVFHGTPNETISASKGRVRGDDYKKLATDYADKLFPYVVFRNNGRLTGIYTSTDRGIADAFSYSFSRQGTVYDLYARADKPFTFDAEGNGWNNIPISVVEDLDISKAGRITLEDVSRSAKEQGYDAVVVNNVRETGSGDNESPLTTDVIVFNSNQVKSADPVTYDDKGNVIPLSERFNENNEDIRYSRKEDQYDILQNANPMLDTYHTGIRSAKDIKNASEVFARKDFSGTPDWTYEDAQKALKNGKITVFSSKPIVNGAFVTPSMMEAESYAGEGNFYQAEVPIEDVAWIDSVEGQYAKVSNEAIQSEPKFSIKLMNHAAAKPVMDEGGKVVGARVFRDKNGDPLLMSGLEVTSETMRLMGKESKIPFVKRFLEKQARFMEKMGEKYTFIGLKDVSNADLEVRRDKNGKPVSIVVSAMVKNGEYPVNFDFSSICKKRQALSKLFEKLSTGENGEFLDSVELSVENLWRINEILSENGFETACLGCFVETKRYGIENWADTFAEKWNKAVLEKNPNAEYFNFASSKDIDFGYVSDEMDRFAENKKDEREKESKRRKKERASFIKKWLKNNPGESEANAEKAYKQWWKKAYNLKADQYKESWFENPALSNEKAIISLVNSGDKMQKLIRKTDLISPKGLKALMALHPDFYGVLYGHFGSGTPKPMVSFTPYNSEIALLGRQVNPNGGMKRYTPEANATLVNKLVEIGGVRIQSFSDFLIQNTFDYMQMVADMAARNFPAHAYTKEIAFAKIFGLTGIKINLSVMFDVDPEGIAPGLDKNGNYVVADKSRQEREKKNGSHVFAFSISYDEAVELQNSEGYDGNVGIIGVGLSDLHIRKMLNDPDIKMVIPYHSSGMPAVIKQLTKLGADSDYTSTQNTLDISKIERDGVDVTKQYGKDYMLNLYKEKGSWKEAFAQFRKDTEGCTITPVKAFASTGNFPLYTGDPVMSLDATNDPKRTAEYYMGWCIENGHFPLFYQFADEENYYKVLYDFNVYHNDGTYAPQNAVENEYPEDLESVIEQYMKEANDFEQAQMPKWDNVINETKEMLKSNSYKEENGKFSRKEPNYGYHAGDLGKAEWYGNQAGSARNSGHFGTGTYFVGDEELINSGGFKERPHHKVDFSKYKLYRPQSYAQGIRVHDLLATINRGSLDLTRLITDIDTTNRDIIKMRESLDNLERYTPTNLEKAEALADRIIGEKGISDVRDEARRYLEGNRTKSDDEIIQEAEAYTNNTVREMIRDYGLEVSDSEREEIYQHQLEAVRRTKERNPDEIFFNFLTNRLSKELELESEYRHNGDYVNKINSLRRLIPQLAKDLGRSKTEVRNAIEKANEVTKGYRGRFKEDSASTIVMKELGFEGVDVRGIKGLDDTFYGSVIYDLKDENVLYSRKSPDSTSTLSTQNTIAKLEEQVKDLKAEFKRTNLKTANQKDVRVQAGRLIQRHGSNMQTQKSLMDTFNKIFSLYKEKGTDAFDEVYEIARDEAVNIVNNIGVIHNEGAEEYKAIKQYLRETPIQIDDAMKRNITDYNDFRKSNFGRLKLVNGETSNIDNVYMELMELFPEQFTEDYTNPHDQLNHIVDVLDNFAPYYESLDGASEEMQDYVVDIASDIMETAYGLQTKKTFADRKYEEKVKAVKKEREKALESRRKALANQRKRDKAKLEALENRRKAETEGLRKEKEKYQEELWKANERTAAERLRGEMDMQRLKEQQRQKEQDKRERRAESEAKTKLLKIARRLDKYKTTEDMRKEIDSLIGDLDLVSKGMTSKTVDKLYDLAEWYENMKENDPDFIADEGIEKKLSRLTKKRIKDMTLDEVRDLYDVLSNIENELRTSKKFIDSEMRKEVKEAGRETIKNVNASKGIAKALRDFDGFFINGTLSPIRQIRRVTGYVDSDPLYIATKELADGQRKMLDYQMNSWKAFDRFMNDKKFIASLNGAKAQEIEVTGTVDGEPYNVKITPDIRMAMYLASKDNDNLRHIKYGGISLPDIKLYKKGKIQEAISDGTVVKFTPSQLREITSHMTEKEKQFADEAFKYYNETSPKAINETSEKLKGYSLAKVKNYFPIHTDTNFLSKDFDMVKFDGTIEGMGFLKERVKASNPIIMTGLVDTLTRSIEMNSKYVGLAIPVRNFGKLFGMKDVAYSEVSINGVKELVPDFKGAVQKSITKKWGDSVYNYIAKFVTDLQSGRRSSDDWENTFNKLRSRYAGAVLTLNASVAIKQAASYPTAAAVLGWSPLAKAMGNVGKVDLDLIAKYTPLQWYRSQGFSTTELGDIKSSSRKTLLEKVPALNWIQGMDVLTTRKLWKASEYYVRSHNKNLKTGTDEYYKAVADIYNRVIEETQPNYTTMQRPGLLRSDSSLVQMLNMFKTQPYQNFNILYDSIGNYVAKREQYRHMKNNETRQAFKDAGRDLRNSVSSQVAQLAVFAAMTSLWALFRRRDDKYKDEEGNLTFLSYLERLGKDMVSNLFADVPFGADIYGTMSSAITGEYYYGFTSVTDSSITDFLNAMTDGYKTVGEWIEYAQSDDPEKQPSKSLYKDTFGVVESASRFAGIPFSNMKNTWDGMFGWAAISRDGEYIGTYEAQKMSFAKDSEMKANLFKAYRNDKNAYNELRTMMINDGFSEESLDNYISKQTKEHKSNAEQQLYDKSMATLEKSDIWKNASADNKEYYTGVVTNLSVGIENKNTEYVTKLAKNGVTNEQVILYKLALKQADAKANNNGSYDKNEKAEALRMLMREFNLTKSQQDAIQGK